MDSDPGRGARADRPADPARTSAATGMDRDQRADRRGRPAGAANLLAVLDDMRPADLANVLQDLSRGRRLEVARALDDERLADVLEELPEHDQVEILHALDPQRAADVLEEMDPDDAADLLAELPKPDQEVLLDLMQPGEPDPVRRRLASAPVTAGWVMTSDPIVLRPEHAAGGGLARPTARNLIPPATH